MLRTRIPRGRGVRRFVFLPLTGPEIEKLESVPTATAGHLDQCSCGRNGGSRLVLEELADLLLVALQHGHELAIEPNADDYALDIEIGASALVAEGALGTKEVTTLESASYAAPSKHRAACEASRCTAPVPLEPVLTLAAIALNHGHAVQLQPDAEGPEVTVTIASERHEAFDRPSGPVPLDTSAVQLAMQQVR